MKIAFLEDNQNFADEIITALSAPGHEVQHFLTGRECLKAVASETFDLCLFDWELPDMSGPEVLSSLKLRGNISPVIF